MLSEFQSLVSKSIKVRRRSVTSMEANVCPAKVISNEEHNVRPSSRRMHGTEQQKETGMNRMSHVVIGFR